MRFNLSAENLESYYRGNISKYLLAIVISLLWVLSLIALDSFFLKLEIKKSIYLSFFILPLFVIPISLFRLRQYIKGFQRSKNQGAWIELEKGLLHLELPHLSFSIPASRFKKIFSNKSKPYWILSLNFFRNEKFPTPENPDLVLEEFRKDLTLHSQEGKLSNGHWSRFFYLASQRSLWISVWLVMILLPLGSAVFILSQKKSLDVQIAEAQALADQGNCQPAITLYERMIMQDPPSAVPFNNLAWVLLTCPNPQFSNPMRALGLVNIAAEKRDFDSAAQDTMACAYAALGDFESAIAFATEFNLPRKRVNQFENKELCTPSN